MNMTLTGSGGPATIDTTGGNIGLSGALTGSGGLDKIGPNTLTISGNNVHTGPTTVFGGVLAAGAANALSPNSDHVVIGGTLDVTVGPQTVKSLTMGSAGAINLQSGNLLTVTNAANLAGTLNLSGVTGPGELMSYGSESGAFSTITGLPGGDRLVYNATQLDIVAGSVWAASVSGNWSDASKWTGGVPNAAGAAATINVPTSLPLTVTIDAPQTIGTLLLGNSASATTGYTLSGVGSNTLTLNNAGSDATITVTDGAYIVNAPVALADNLAISNTGTLAFVAASSITGNSYGLTINGPGTLVLAGSNSYGGGTTLNAGVLQTGHNSALGLPAAPLAVNGGTLDIHGFSLNVGPLIGSGTIDNLSGNGSLTVGNDDTSGTFSGTMQDTAGQLSLDKTGSGTLGLSGKITLAGSATVSGGAVNQPGGYLQVSALVVSGGVYNLSGTGQIAATNEYVGCSGSGTFTQTGGTNTIASALYLGTNPGSSGTYNLFGGLLVVPSILQGFGSSSLNITGGSLTGLAGGVTFSLPIVMGSSGSGAIFDTSGSSLSVPSPISGPGDLVKMGPGTLVLSGSDSYLGGTYVDAGRLEVTNAMSLPDGTRLTIGAGATFIFDPAAGAAPAAASPLAAASGAAAVPEPGTLVLLATGALLAIFAARQRRKRQLPFGLSGRCTLPTRTIRGSGSAVAGVVLAWAISCGSSPVWAGTYTWIGSPTGIDWNDPANWGGTLPGSADIGLFPAGSYMSQPSIISPASVGGIWDTGADSVSIGGTNALTLFGTTINDNPNTGIELDAGAGPLTINAPLILQNNQQWVNNSASLLTVNGPVSGAGSLTLLGSGMLTLTGMNTYSGNTTVDGGTLQLVGGQLVSPVQYVGNLGIGNFVQSGGINVLSGSGELYLGYAPGASGSYNFSGGSLSAPTEILGYAGSGAFTQSGGIHSVSGILCFGYSAGGVGTYGLSGSGQLSAAYEYVGLFGTGNFTQSAGSNSVSNLYLGINAGSGGTYSLGGSGLLSATTEVVGFSGSGSFAQSGGTHSLSGGLYFAYLAGSSGTYSLSGSGLLTTPSECIGWSGSGSFTQSGGTHAAGNLVLAQNAGSAGTYSLNGGSLSVSGLAVGAGTASFNLGGGTLGAAAPWTSSVNVNLSGIGGPGAVDTTGGNIELSGNLTGAGGLAKIGAGTLTLTGSNTFSGGATLNGGVLSFAVGSLPYDASTPNINFYGGTLQWASGNTQDISAGIAPISAGQTAFLDTNSNNVTFATGLSGSGGLTKIGAGTLTLTGSNTFSGNTTVDGGTLQLPSGWLASSTQYVGYYGSGAFAQSGGTNMISGSFVVAQSASSVGTYNLSGGSLSASNENIGLTGTGTFTQTGGTNTIANALYLGANPGSSGTYNLLGGLLVVPNIPPSLGLGVLNVSGGSLTGVTNGVILSAPIVLAPSSSGTFDTSSSSLTVTGQISGSGGLNKTGSATLVLAGNNAYSGDTTVAHGILLLSNANAAQNTTVAVSVDNGLQFSGGIGTFNVGSIGGSGGLALTDTGGNPVVLVTGGNNANTTYSGTISGAGTLVHNGSGSLLLTSSNTYSGGTILGPDAVGVGNSAAFGSGYVMFAGNATVYFTSNMVIPNPFILAAGVIGTVNSQLYTVVLSGPITGSGGFNTTGAGTVALSNSNNFSGNTSISQGTLQLANAMALQNSTVNVNADNGLQFSPGIGTFNVGGLSGSGALALSDTNGGPVALAAGGNNANTTYSGSIGGNGGLIKNGGGSLTLTGSNSFSGGLTLDPGTVSINGDAALGDPTGIATWGGLSANVIFVANSTLQALGSFALAPNRNIAIGAGATATFDTSGNTLTIGGPISGPGALAVIGSGTLLLTNSETFSGGTTIGPATLQLGNGGSAGWLNGGIVDNGLLVFDHSGSTSFSAGISGSGSVQLAGSGQLSLGGANTYTGNTTVSVGMLVLGNPTALQDSTLVLSGGSLNLSNFSATLGGLGGTGSLALGSGTLTVGGNGNATTYSGSLSGGGALVKIGGGILALTGSSSFSGGTALDQGILSIGSDAALGAAPGMPTTNITFAGSSTLQASSSFALAANRNITIGAGATATFDTHGNTLAIGGVISGSGALSVVGGGALVLTNAETYSGGTTIGPGTLQLGNGGSTGWLSGNIVDNGLLVFDRSDSAASFTAAISGSGSVQQTGSGTLLFGGTNTFTGTTIISAGILELRNATALQSSTVVPSGGTLDLNGFNATLGGLGGSGTLSLTNGTLTVGGNGSSTTFGGALLGLASFIKTGSGLCVLTGNNGFSGLTTINAGVLEAATTASIPGLFTGQVSVGPAGVLAVGVGGSQQWTAANINTLLSISSLFGSGGTLGIDTSGGNFADGNLSGSGLGLVKLGPNTLMLTGTNSCSGNTLVGNGALELATTAALPGVFTGKVNVAAGAMLTVPVGGSQQWTAANISSLLAVNGLFSPGASLGIDTDAGSFSIGSMSIGTSGVGLSVAGSQALILTGSTNISGVTGVSQGVLLLANSAALANSTVAINVDNGLQFSPGTGTYCLGGLSGGNLLQLADTAENPIRLVVGGNGVSTTFSGQIGGAGSFTKTGAGTLVLSGWNSYNGDTTVDAGTLCVTGLDALSAGTNLTVGPGGTFVFDPAYGEDAAPLASVVLASATASLGAAAVPEPGTSALLASGSLLAIIAVCLRKRDERA